MKPWEERMEETQEHPWVTTDKRRVRPEDASSKATVETPNDAQSKTDARLAHLIDKMAQHHATFLYHQGKAQAAMQEGQRINQLIMEYVHKISEKYRIVDAPQGQEEAPRRPQNLDNMMEEILRAVAGKYGEEEG